jgi:hypothetical protein
MRNTPKRPRPSVVNPCSAADSTSARRRRLRLPDRATPLTVRREAYHHHRLHRTDHQGSAGREGSTRTRHLRGHTCPIGSSTCVRSGLSVASGGPGSSTATSRTCTSRIIPVQGHFHAGAVRKTEDVHYPNRRPRPKCPVRTAYGNLDLAGCVNPSEVLGCPAHDSGAYRWACKRSRTAPLPKKARRDRHWLSCRTSDGEVI